MSNKATEKKPVDDREAFVIQGVNTIHVDDIELSAKPTVRSEDD